MRPIHENEQHELVARRIEENRDSGVMRPPLAVGCDRRIIIHPSTFFVSGDEIVVVTIAVTRTNEEQRPLLPA